MTRCKSERGINEISLIKSETFPYFSYICYLLFTSFSTCKYNIDIKRIILPFTNYKLYRIIWEKTDSSRSILARVVWKTKLENLKKRKTVFYYDNIHNIVQKYPYLYIYIYISLYEENRYLQVNKNGYARCVMYGLSGDMDEQHESS